jgi:hypothetical protein
MFWNWNYIHNNDCNKRKDAPATRERALKILDWSRRREASPMYLDREVLGKESLVDTKMGIATKSRLLQGQK